MHQTLESAFNHLNQKYPWYQIKRHSVKGQRMVTCVLQSPTDKKDFHSSDAPDGAVLSAINDALTLSERKESEKQKG